MSLGEKARNGCFKKKAEKRNIQARLRVSTETLRYSRTKYVVSRIGGLGVQ